MKQSQQISQLYQTIANKYLNIDPIAQLQYIKQQQKILTSIKNILQKRKYINQQILSINGVHINNNINNTCNSDILDQSLLNNQQASTWQMSIIQPNQYQQEDGVNRSKFREQMENSTIGSAIKDVQLHCSDDTYEIIKQYLFASKVKQTQNMQKLNSKLVQQRDQLASQIIILKLQKTNLQKQLQRYKKIVSGVQQQKKKLKQKVDYVLKKQNQIFKLQASFAFKQKINLQLKKRYQRLVTSFITNQAKIQKMYEELDKMWNIICTKMEHNLSCEGTCWKKDIMKKAKQHLIQQRKLIKQQSLHLQKQYEVMNIVSEQFKRIFQQSQKNGNLSDSTIVCTQKSNKQQQVHIPKLNLKF